MEFVGIDLKYPLFYFIGSLFILFILSGRYYSLFKNEGRTGIYLLLRGLKFIGMILLLCIFFCPEVVYKVEKEKISKHIVLIDNSKSIPYIDSISTKSLKNTINKNLNKSEIEFFSFGKNVEKLHVDSLRFDEQLTILEDTKFIDNVLKQPDVEIKSINIITDGRFNSGMSPLYLQIDYPLNIFYIGEEKNQFDLALKNIEYEPVVYGDSKQGENFYLNVNSTGDIVSHSGVITVEEEGRKLKEIAFSIPKSSGNTRVLVKVPYESDKSVRKLDFVISTQDEDNINNNRYSVYQKKMVTTGEILIVAEKLSFDVKFFRDLLEKVGYSYKIVKNYNEAGNTKYDLVALFSDDKLDGYSGSVLAFWNKGFNKNNFSNILGAEFVSIGSFIEGSLISKSSGSGGYLYNYNDESYLLDDVIPLEFDRGFNIKSGYDIVLSGKYLDQETGVVWQSQDTKNKKIVVNLKGFWKGLFTQKAFSGYSNLEKFFKNMVDYLLTDSLEDKLLVNISADEFSRGESVKFSGKVLDVNYQPFENGRVVVKNDSTGADVELKFENGIYDGSILADKLGFNSYTITVYKGDEIYLEKKGDFRVKENNFEAMYNTPDLVLLDLMAVNNNGNLYRYEEFEKYISNIDNTPKTYYENKTFPITENLLYFIITVLFLSLEWILRRTVGLN